MLACCLCAQEELLSLNGQVSNGEGWCTQPESIAWDKGLAPLVQSGQPVRLGITATTVMPYFKSKPYKTDTYTHTVVVVEMPPTQHAGDKGKAQSAKS